MEQWVEILNRLLFLLHFLASAHEDTEMWNTHHIDRRSLELNVRIEL